MKKSLLTIALLIAIFSLGIIGTYGLFESRLNIEMNSKIAKFNISINDSLITTEDANFTIDSFYYDNDEYTNDSKFAPGTTVYFDLDISGNDTEVSVKYEVTLDLTNITNESIVIEKVIDEDGNDITRTDEFKYTDLLTLDDIKVNKAKKVRVYLKWNDENDDDYITVKDTGSLEIPVNIRLSQYLGEEIVEYTE